MSLQHWAHFTSIAGRSAYLGHFYLPLSLGALAVMGINDAWLRRDFPNLTGKSGDVAVLIFFPFFLMALQRREALIALIGGMKCVRPPVPLG